MMNIKSYKMLESKIFHDTQIRGAKRGNPCKSRDNMTPEHEPILLTFTAILYSIWKTIRLLYNLNVKAI